jgi:hypothetical protein
VNAFYGDFSKSSSFGDRRGIMVQVLRERYAEKLQVGIRDERFHIVNHDVGTTTVKGPVAALYGTNRTSPPHLSARARPALRSSSKSAP